MLYKVATFKLFWFKNKLFPLIDTIRGLRSPVQLAKAFRNLCRDIILPYITLLKQGTMEEEDNAEKRKKMNSFQISSMIEEKVEGTIEVR